MAIGQGDVKATPLQIANAYSAISATGILRKPLLVKKIAEPGGAAAQEFTAETVHPLPVSASNLEFIREGLTAVIQSSGGTSTAAWAGNRRPAGKSARGGHRFCANPSSSSLR
jgi:penicillin-binding protein 2